MNPLARFSLLALLAVSPALADGPVEKPVAIGENGVWKLFLVEGGHTSLRKDRQNYVFLTQVESLGPVPKAKSKAKAKTADEDADAMAPELQKGVLTVKKKLFAMPNGVNVDKITKLTTDGCEGLRVGDYVIVFVNDGDNFYGEFAIEEHAGTSSKLGVNLGKSDAKGEFPADAKRFMELLKPGSPPIREFSKEDFKIWKHFDPVGAAEELDLMKFSKIKPPEN